MNISVSLLKYFLIKASFIAIFYSFVLSMSILENPLSGFAYVSKLNYYHCLLLCIFLQTFRKIDKAGKTLQNLQEQWVRRSHHHTLQRFTLHLLLYIGKIRVIHRQVRLIMRSILQRTNQANGPKHRMTRIIRFIRQHQKRLIQ